MADRIYDDTRAMNIIASALLDLQGAVAPASFEELLELAPPEARRFLETVQEVVEMTGRDPDAAPPESA